MRGFARGPAYLVISPAKLGKCPPVLDIGAEERLIRFRNNVPHHRMWFVSGSRVEEVAVTVTEAPGNAVRPLRAKHHAAFKRVPWWWMVPGLGLIIGFHYVAVVFGAAYAFTDWNGIGAPVWVGLANFYEIWSDPTTAGALWNTLKLSIAFVVLANLTGLLLAMALNKTLKSRYALRSLFFLPFVMSPLAVSFIWRYIFDYEGALNQFLRAAGLTQWAQPWLGSPVWALWSVLIVMVWSFSGLTMVIYLAGLQSMPDELVEAATVDGASPWMRFRRVVFPLLAPATTIAVTMTTIIGLRAFDQVMALTNGGPVGASETLATEVWKRIWLHGRFGYGAAIALVLTLLIAGVSLFQLAVLRWRESRM